MNVIFIAYYIKINYNVGFASPEFDNILTNKPECIILRRKKNSLWCMQFYPKEFFMTKQDVVEYAFEFIQLKSL